MFRRKLWPVWIGIFLLSGMFLMGQDAWVEPPECVDVDGDGYGMPASVSCSYPEADCDDADADVNPGVVEGPYGDAVCSDGIDNDCDGTVDDLPGGCSEWNMADIPAGCFDMGDAFAEGGPDEVPVHNVCISAFEMDVHEVTNAEYAECVGAGVCTIPSDTGSDTRATYYGDPAYDNFPVIFVQWIKAANFCEWAGKRLPTEAEWEYAARGGLSGKRYVWGDTITGTDANYYNSGDPWDNDTSQVGYYAANGYGLYDMSGNVWEWVNDWYQMDYYSVSPVNDPQGPSTGVLRIVHGGSWYSVPHVMRVSYRSGYVPDFDYFDIGFRCAR